MQPTQGLSTRQLSKILARINPASQASKARRRLPLQKQINHCLHATPFSKSISMMPAAVLAVTATLLVHGSAVYAETASAVATDASNEAASQAASQVASQIASQVASKAANQAANKSAQLFDMLKRMSDADNKRNYSGTFVMIKGGELSTMRVTHGQDSEGTWESLESLDGEPRTVMRKGNNVISLYPGRQLMTVRASGNKPDSLHFSLPENVDSLSSYYSMQQRDNDRIAGRQTLVVDLVPNDGFRYGYRYWIDRDTGMLLRCDLVDENNSVVEQMMFTSLDYHDSPPESAFSNADLSNYQKVMLDEQTRQGVATEVSTGSQWQVEQLPDGFMLQESAMHRPVTASAEASDDSLKTVSSKPVTASYSLLQLVYSDGLASVSVFIEKQNGDDDRLVGPASMGAVNAYANPVGKHYITVVGEVPPRTVKMLAESIAYQGADK